ncbi:MAG: hypothetical protein ABW123_16400 [Cystobacter sp.]
MLIQRTQLALFTQFFFQDYQQDLVRHFGEHYPQQTLLLGVPGLLQAIQNGCTQAERHGFETKRDLCLYTHLTFMLGIGFDSDPQLEWAQEILQDPLLVDSRSRMHDLWEQAMIYMERVVGPKGIHPQHVLQTVQRRDMARDRVSQAQDEDVLLSFFQEVWPEKASYVGTTALRVLISQNRRAAAGHGIVDGPGREEFALHAFLFGHRFHVDPLYSWDRFMIKAVHPRP